MFIHAARGRTFGNAAPHLGGGVSMKITIESTTKIVELNGVPARIWEGKNVNSDLSEFLTKEIPHVE